MELVNIVESFPGTFGLGLLLGSAGVRTESTRVGLWGRAGAGRF